jgi:hypothetical protein
MVFFGDLQLGGMDDFNSALLLITIPMFSGRYAIGYYRSGLAYSTVVTTLSPVPAVGATNYVGGMAQGVSKKVFKAAVSFYPLSVLHPDLLALPANRDLPSKPIKLKLLAP